MWQTPWPFLGIGLFVGGIALFFVWATVTVERRMAARAGELLAKGTPSEIVARQLVAEGLDEPTAEKVVRAVLMAQALEQSEGLLDAGVPAESAARKLEASGGDGEIAREAAEQAEAHRMVRRHPILWTLAALACFAVGPAAMFLGLVLRDGNRTGRLATFPFAGTLTMILGGAFTAFGIGVAALLFNAWTYKPPGGKVVDDWDRIGED